MPSYSEMMDLFDYSSKNSVHKLVKKLVKTNFFEQDSQGRLIPESLQKEVKLLGQIEAGFPSPAEEELLDTIDLDNFLVDKREATFLLKVEGDSMQDAGILQGDLVVVERTNKIKSGDIVIAQVDNEWTIKYYRQKSGKKYLEPANKKYKCIYPENELKIEAVVKAVIRKVK